MSLAMTRKLVVELKNIGSGKAPLVDGLYHDLVQKYGVDGAELFEPQDTFTVGSSPLFCKIPLADARKSDYLEAAVEIGLITGEIAVVAGLKLKFAEIGAEGIIGSILFAINIDTKQVDYELERLEELMTDLEDLGIYSLNELTPYLELTEGLYSPIEALELFLQLAAHLDLDKDEIEKYLDFAKGLSPDCPAAAIRYLSYILQEGIFDLKTIEELYGTAIGPFNGLNIGDDETRCELYSVLLSEEVFKELVSNSISRERMFGLVKMMGEDLKYFAGGIESAFMDYLVKNSGNAAIAIDSLCQDLARNHGIFQKLFALNTDISKREKILDHISFTLEFLELEEVVKSLRGLNYSDPDIIELIAGCIDMNRWAGIFAQILITARTIKLLGIHADKETVQRLMYESYYTEMNESTLSQGTDILKKLCEDNGIISGLADRYGGELFQILYFLHNSWRAEIKRTNNPKLTYEQAIQGWMKENNVKNRSELLALMLGLCVKVFHAHGIRYWGRYSINSMKAILAGEAEPETGLVITTRDGDYNGAFYDIYKDLELMAGKGFNVVVLETDTDDEVFNFLDARLARYRQAEERGEPFDLPLFASMDISGHGYRELVILYKDDEDRYTLDCSDEEWRKYSILFKAKARISLDSCLSGMEFLDCLGEYLGAIPEARFRGALDIITSELKEDAKTGELYREYDNGQSLYREFTTPKKQAK